MVFTFNAVSIGVVDVRGVNVNVFDVGVSTMVLVLVLA